ncbi:MAG: hypothetical protein EXS58_16910 [Candidatus Latescibacteria bacterium]|nr:hypothetical protein [Candidatus Latescibacterota bacterium]
MEAVGSAGSCAGSSAMQQLQSQKPAQSAEETKESLQAAQEEEDSTQSLQLQVDAGVGGVVDQLA